MTSFERKQKSEELLLSLGITLVDTLPCLEEEDQVDLRSPQEVTERIIILSYLNCAASDPGLRQEMMMFLIHEGLWDKTSDQEQALFHKPLLTEDDLDTMLWRTESIYLLLWVIGKIDSLDLPEKEADPNEIFSHLPGFLESTKDFIETNTMRSVSEILDQNDFILRLNWAFRENQSNPAEMLTLHPGIAYERYFALNWVTKMRKNWKKVYKSLSSPSPWSVSSQTRII